MSMQSRLIISIFCTLLSAEFLIAFQTGYLHQLIVLAGP